MKKYKGIISDKSDEIIENNGYDFFSSEMVMQDKVEYHHLTMGKGKSKEIYINKIFENQTLNKELEKTLSEDQLFYRNNGYVIKRKLIPDEVINNYLKMREEIGLGLDQFNVDEYIEHKEARDLLLHKPLTELLNELHSAEMGLVFMLTKLISTQRSWHQDSYLDHDDALPRVAVWIALDDIAEDCGPFEFIPGSHKWFSLSNSKINEFMEDKYKWPHGQRNIPKGQTPWGRASELFVAASVEKKIKRENIKTEKFIAKKGDVLVWYGRLMHKGSIPINRDAIRPAIIGHYAPIFEKDRGLFLRENNGSFFLKPKNRY